MYSQTCKRTFVSPIIFESDSILKVVESKSDGRKSVSKPFYVRCKSTSLMPSLVDSCLTVCHHHKKMFNLP